jgi:outer membrane lipoprotein-sorting protein
MKQIKPFAYWTTSLVAAALLAVTMSGPGMGAEEATGWNLNTALKQLDKNNGDFRTAVADVKMTVVTGKDAEPQVQSGKAYFSRDGRFRIDFSTPAVKTILCTQTDLFIHDPAGAMVERYSLGKHPERLEPYAKLGFSLSGKAMSKDYLVALLGEEMMGDRKTLIFQLTPKADKVRASVSRIQIAIEQGSWLPLQQKMFPGDPVKQLTMDYAQVSRNVPMDDSMFKPKWPKGTKTISR